MIRSFTGACEHEDVSSRKTVGYKSADVPGIHETTLRAAVFVEVGCRGCSEGVIDEKNSGWVPRQL